ncbi:tRNA (adenosine(37)-N6)-threonylcarbamoyltransferase complex dimerization subunit type 1 TsaB [Rhodobacterales bacterium HKCCE2091]|nr:tRNA (adenosine(37)-N6)-threonylcarbamoyltransferase complex dimerization subunit type 1 TsaB [Rhodobacterales bacterium HKCCE2091]
MSVLLAFDCSAAHCSVALLSGGRVTAEAHAEMARGQAEALMPMIADLMAEAGMRRGDLSAIAVGTGPGNFTGLRIAVAAARGMALGLARPAIGVTGFAALVEAEGAGTGRVLVSLPAPRDQVYLQVFDTGAAAAEPLLAMPDAPPPVAPKLVLGAAADRIAAALGGETGARVAALARPASPIARVAARMLEAGGDIPRPAPLYVRAPDAAPSRDAAPVILP